MRYSNRNFYLLLTVLFLSHLPSCKKSDSTSTPSSSATSSEPNQESAQEQSEGNLYLALATVGNVENIVTLDENNNITGMYEFNIVSPASDASSKTTASAGLGLAGGEDGSGTAPAAGAKGSSSVVIGGKTIDLPRGYVSARGLQGEPIGTAPAKAAIGDTIPLGKGTQGIAFLVQEIKDDGTPGGLWALKFDNRTVGKSNISDNDPLLNRVSTSLFNDDVVVARSMQAGFGNQMDAKLLRTSAGIPVVVKTAIVGGTLKEQLETGTFFSDETADGKAARANLPALFHRMSAADSEGVHKVYEDLNAANIMWDSEGKQWVIVDAKPPITVSNFTKALEGNTNSFLEKLPLGASLKQYNARKTVFNRLGRGMYLPNLSKENYAKLKPFLSEVKKDAKGSVVYQLSPAVLQHPEIEVKKMVAPEVAENLEAIEPVIKKRRIFKSPKTVAPLDEVPEPTTKTKLPL